MGLAQKIGERLLASKLRGLLKGRKTYLTALGGVVVALGALLDVPGTSELDLNNADAVVLGFIAVLGATLKAAIARMNEGPETPVEKPAALRTKGK